LNKFRTRRFAYVTLAFILIIMLMPVNYANASTSVKPQNLSVENLKLDMTVGSNQVLNVKVSPFGADKSFIITTSDKAVVKVNNAQKKLSAVSAGKVNITVTTSNGKSCEFTITVYPKEVKIVSTETELKSVLRKMKSGTLVLSSTKKGSITIPDGNYTKIILYVDLPEGKLINKGTFKSVHNGLVAANSSTHIIVKAADKAYHSLKNEDQVKLGDIICFGSYEQDNNLKNGSEGIEWYVLAKKGNMLQVISCRALKFKDYEDDAGYWDSIPDWNRCSVRNWLNNEFYTEAFNEQDALHIATTRFVEYAKYADEVYSGYYGYTTNDKVFLLSKQEYLNYYAVLGEKISSSNMTSYAKKSSGMNSNELKLVENILLLRSKYNSFHPDSVSSGEVATAKEGCIRPTIWITIPADPDAEVTQYTDDSVFETSVKNDGITITGIRNNRITSLKIPDEIDDKKVIAIAENAFSGCKKLTSIIIPEGVTTIAANAFSGCSALLELAIPSSLTNLDTTAFSSCKKLVHIYRPDNLNSNLIWLLRYDSKEMTDIYDIIDADTSRWGLWDLTYREFIELYRSIGTDNDLFLKMLKEKGTCHSDSSIWFDYDSVPGIEIRFDDILTEKIVALQYAPFEYNREDLESGNWGKDTTEAYLDHGGVCTILANTYRHFIYYILGEMSWEYASLLTDEPNHEALAIRTEEGKCFQIDNCEVDFWWLGIETIPDMQKIGNYAIDIEWQEAFNKQKDYLNTSENLVWCDFSIVSHYDNESETWKSRPIWYDYERKDWNAYLGDSLPMYYVCTYTGLEKIISMAGYAKLNGYIDVDDLEFSKP